MKNKHFLICAILIGVFLVILIGTWSPWSLKVSTTDGYLSIVNGRIVAAGDIRETEKEPVELISERTETSKKYDLGNDQYAISASIGAIHYQDDGWKDIDTTAYDAISVSSFTAWYNEVPYVLAIGDDSARRIYPDRDNLNAFIEIGVPDGKSYSTDELSKTADKWTWDDQDTTMSITIGNTRVKYAIVLKDAAAPSTIRVPYTLYGLTRHDSDFLIKDEIVARMVQPYAIDAAGVYRDCGLDWTETDFTVSLDTKGLVYPITIDPTIDTQVGASANDGYWASGGAFSDDNSYCYVGREADPYNSWNIFTGISGLSGATITTAYCEMVTASIYGTGMYSKVRCEKVAAPSAPDDADECEAWTQTTAAVDWDEGSAGITSTSPSLISVFQEIADSLDPSALNVVLNDDDGGNGNGVRYRAYDNSYGMTLYLEYTEGGSTPDISNAPDTLALGVLSPSSTYWSNGSEPSWPLTDGDAYFEVANVGSVSVNITVKGTNPTGGTGHTLVSGSPGADELRVTAFNEGDGSANGTIVLTSEANFIGELASSANTSWELKFETGTFTDGVARSCNITLTATAS